MLAQSPEQTKRTVHQLLEKAGIQVMAEMRLHAPVAVTGDLRRTVHYVFQADGAVAVEPTASYAEYVEKGTKPHFVSVKPGTPLYRWAMQKGIPPFALKASIAKKGTKPHPFIQPTYDIMEPKVQRLFSEGIDALIGQLNG
jgi:HK97 gp10 family phage protein